MNHVRNTIAFFRKNPRYVFVGLILLIAISFNSVIIGSSAKDSKATSNDGVSLNQNSIQKVDIDGEHLTKIYDRVMNTKQGDWHRISFTSKALDQDEKLHVIVRSDFGREREIGTSIVPNDAKEHYVEFVIDSDDVYRDVLIRKDKNGSDTKWQGGRVALDSFFVSRLQISSDVQAQKLRSTVLGVSDVIPQLLPSEVNEKDPIVFPKKSHFIFGRVFDVPEDRYLLNVTMNMKYSDADISGKYRLELHAYNTQTKEISGDVLKKNSFSLKVVKSLADKDGHAVFDFPVQLKKDGVYFLGISDSQVSGAKNVLQVSDMETDHSTGATGSALLLMAKPYMVSEGHSLLTNAKVEDLGLLSRYTYSTNHKATDLMDVYATSGKVTYDEETQVVVGDESSDTSFTYKIDTLRPFSILRMEASQLNVDKGQIRMDYSYDESSWIGIDFTQEDESPQMFNLIISANEQKHSIVYFRVSYAGEKDGKRTFGLRDFHITANVSNDTIIR